MTHVPARELRNGSAADTERARNVLTTAELQRLRPAIAVTEPHPHDLWNDTDTTDELGPIA
jgi:hypothetical protein